MRLHIFKKKGKRIVSGMLVFAMLVTSLSALTSFRSDAATGDISHDEMSTTVELLTEVVGKNLAVYSIDAPSKSKVQSALQTAAQSLGLHPHSESTGEAEEGSEDISQIQYADKVLETPVSSVIQVFIDDHNTTGQSELDKKKETDKAAAQKKLDDANTKLSNLKTQLSKATTDDEKANIQTQITAAEKEVSNAFAALSAIDTDTSYTYSAITFDVTRCKNYTGGQLRSSYTYADLLMDYIREHDNAAGTLYDDRLSSLISEKVTYAKPDQKFKDIIKSVDDYIQATNVQVTNYSDIEYVDSFTSEHTVTYSNYVLAHGTPPAGTLFIGTYLIDASAINDVYYRYAVDSMGYFSQNIMFYKSELDGGNWKDVISAVGLSDILPTSATVENAELNKYRVTCVIGHDGIPRYPDDLSEADIFTMVEPYDMESVPELVKLKLMYDAQVVSQDTADLSNRYTADILFRFFNYDGVGDNESMMIIRNRGYRDYVYDHPEQGRYIAGTNPIPMSEKSSVKDIKKYTYITQDEIKYVTDLQFKAMHLSCNMPQTQDRYPDHQDAWIDQLLSWMEYYGNHKFDNTNTTANEGKWKGKPIILPIENMSDSTWERLDWREDWKNPQSYMFIVNGVPGTNDQKKFVEEWLSDTVITTKELVMVPVRVGVITTYRAKMQDVDYKLDYDFVSTHKEYVNYIFAAECGLADTGQTFTAAKVTYGKKWNEFVDLIYRYMDWLRNMYDIRDDITYSSDETLKQLNALYITERNAGNIDEADTLMALMSRVDATRRAEIYYNLVFNEDNNVVVGPSLMYVLDLLMDGKGDCGQNYTFISGDDDGSYASNDAIITAVEDAVENCQKSYFKYLAMSLTNTGTVLKKREYELSQQVLNAASDSERSRLLHQLAILYNIEEGAIVNKDEEKAMIEDIIPEAENLYATDIHATASADYLEMSEVAGVSKATLKTYLELQKDEANTKVSQLQQLIIYYCLRSNQSQGILYINRRLDWAENQYEDIKSDDPFGRFAQESLDEHVKWLKEILKKVKNGTLTGNVLDDADGAADLEGDLLDALDNNDWYKAQEVEEASRNGNGGGGGNGGDGRGDTGDGDLDGPGTGDDNPFQPSIDKIEKLLIDNIDKDWDPKPYITALGELGDGDLDKIKRSFEERNWPSDVIDTIDDAIRIAGDPTKNLRGDTSGSNGGGGNGMSGRSDDGSGNGGVGGRDYGDGGGSETGGDGDDGTPDGDRLTDDDLKDIIQDIFGKGLMDLDDDEKAIVVAACTRFGKDYRYDEVSEFGRGVMYQALDEENGFFYHQFTADTTTEYVNLAAVDKPRIYTGYRYVKQGRKVTMTQIGRATMSGSYTFTIGSKDMYNRSGVKKDLTKNTAQQKDEYIRGSLTRTYAYLDEGDAVKYLGISCEYVNQSEYAVFLTTSMETKVSEFYDAIEAAAAALEAGSAAE